MRWLGMALLAFVIGQGDYQVVRCWTPDNPFPLHDMVCELDTWIEPREFVGTELVVVVEERTADLDGDGDVDAADYALFARQFTGPQ